MCGTTAIPHKAKGLCMNCYNKLTQQRNSPSERVRGAFRLLTKDKLIREYTESGKSLGDIAKMANCSRQNVYKLLRKFGIKLRTKSDARSIAYEREKLDYLRRDQEGNLRLVRPMKHKVNESFFSSWSNEMAYVLGWIFTDGCLHPGRILDPTRHTTLTIPRFTLAQSEKEPLEKILSLMDSDSTILYRRRENYDGITAGALYYFHINSGRIYADLISLGLKPDKSKDIAFPNIPEAYLRHFIRGCWDGDGSVHFQNEILVASYTSGSYSFLERLVGELFKVGVYKTKIDNANEEELDRIRTQYPQGPYPLTIHRHKSAKSPCYYITTSRKESLECKFTYFYDGVDESTYLSRKYLVFGRGLGHKKTIKS